MESAMPRICFPNSRGKFSKLIAFQYRDQYLLPRVKGALLYPYQVMRGSGALS